MDLHDKIRGVLLSRLEQKHFTGKQIADALGVAPSRITEIKKGSRRIQTIELVTLARLLGIEESMMAGAHEIQWIPVVAVESVSAGKVHLAPSSRFIPVQKINEAQPQFAVDLPGDVLGIALPGEFWAAIDTSRRKLFEGAAYLVEAAPSPPTVMRYWESPSRFEPIAVGDRRQEIVMGEAEIAVIGRIVCWGGHEVRG